MFWQEVRCADGAEPVCAGHALRPGVQDSNCASLERTGL
jgi:hypothetical protein